MTAFVGLIRGINVGRAKRIAMSELRSVFECAGGTKVETLLNSGNVVFLSRRRSKAEIALAAEAAIEARCAFSAQVVVISRGDLKAICDENPLAAVARDPSRHLVAFPSRPEALVDLRSLARQTWSPDEIRVGSKAAYLWCEAGLLQSGLLKAATRMVGERITCRNWATVCKLKAMAHAIEER